MPNFTGQQAPWSDANDINAHSFLIRQILATVAGSALVRVVSCTNSSGVSPVGTVDVLPLVNQIDGNGAGTPHGALHSLPYARIQGGANAVILDPVAGDIGIAVFCDRDISHVKVTGKQGNPGSFRQNDMSDGVYLFTCISTSAPTQYIQFTAGGINVVTPTFTVTGNLVVSGTATAGAGGADSVTLQRHTHSGGAPPTAGT